MHALYLASVWLHVLAATAWIGGILFIAFVVVPWLRTRDRAQAAAFFSETGPRFRTLGWTCFAIVLVTGTYNLWVRGVRLSHLVDPAWHATGFGAAVMAKLAVFGVVLAVSAWHDFFLGPRAAAAVAADPTSPEAERMRKMASWIGRVNGLLALLLVALAVVIVRGWPF